MKSLKLYWILTVFVFMRGSSIKLLAQDIDIASQEEKALRLEQKLDSLRVSHSQLMNQAEIIAGRIELYRSKDILNAREHRNLEKQLQESQRLANQVRSIESRMQEVNRNRLAAIETLSQLIKSELDRLIQFTEKDSSLIKQDVLNRIQRLLAKKQACEARLVMPRQFTDSELKIDAQPWDTPRQLLMKGDLLSDREEALHGEIDLVEERIQSLREEKNIRTKVAELARDLDLFDEREELFGRQAGNVADQSNLLSYWDATFERTATAKGGGQPENWTPEVTRPSLNQNSDPGMRGTFPRSPENIQDSIERLERHRDRMRARADSLNQKAQWFYDEANKKQK
jgi:hypothetical protein